MQIIEKSALGVRTAIYKLVSRTRASEITVFPMIHVGEPRFYRQVKDRLSDMDLILFEGVSGETACRISQAYSLFPDKNRNGLIVQPELNPDHFAGELIHADIDGEAFEKEWEKLPWKLRLLLNIISPFYGIYTRYFVDSRAYYETAGLELLSGRDDIFASEDLLLLDDLILVKRDKLLIKKLDELIETHAYESVKIAVVFGAAHMRAVLRHLVKKLDFFVAESEWMTIVDWYE